LKAEVCHAFANDVAGWKDQAGWIPLLRASAVSFSLSWFPRTRSVQKGKREPKSSVPEGSESWRLDELEERRSDAALGTADSPGLHEGVVRGVSGELDAVRAHRLAGDQELDADASGGSLSPEVSHELAGLVAVALRVLLEPDVISGNPQILLRVLAPVEILVVIGLDVGAEVGRVGDGVVVAVGASVEGGPDLLHEGVVRDRDVPHCVEVVRETVHGGALVEGVGDAVVVLIYDWAPIRPRMSVTETIVLAAMEGGAVVVGIHDAVAVGVGELGENDHVPESLRPCVVDADDRGMPLELGELLLEARVLALERGEPVRDRGVRPEIVDCPPCCTLVGTVLEPHPDAADGDGGDHAQADDEEAVRPGGGRCRLRARCALVAPPPDGLLLDAVEESGEAGEETEAAGEEEEDDGDDHTHQDRDGQVEELGEEVGHGASVPYRCANDVAG